MSKIRIGLSTQTPLLRGASVAALFQKPIRQPTAFHAQTARGGGVQVVVQNGNGEKTDQRDADGVATVRMGDHHVSPGGVSRMVLQSVRAWRRQGWIDEAHWFCLQPSGPERLRIVDEAIDLHHLRLPADELGAYARTKELLWDDIHGLDPTAFGPEDFRFYARYNGLASDAILKEAPDLDVAYVHDFQLLQVGALVGLAAPCVLRWHVPFDPLRIRPYTRRYLVKMMEAFDGLIVSTRRDLEGLVNAGFHGKVHQIYPHSDPEDGRSPAPLAEEEFAETCGVPDGAPMILCVARMDPVKRQDLLIRAMRRLRAAHPDAYLVLVGNGSFSGSPTGGLGLSKASRWRQHLEGVTKELGVGDRVVFTGWLPDALVSAAYARADVVVLPSDIEGFGLTPYEGWAHGKPCVVSNGCGIVEIVQHGVNGFVFPAGDHEALTGCLDGLLGDREGAARMGDAGRVALRAHSADRAAAEESAFLQEAMESYGGHA